MRKALLSGEHSAERGPAAPPSRIRAHTFAHKDDANPQRRIAGRNAHENAVKRCMAQAGAAEEESERADAKTRGGHVQVGQQVLLPKGQQGRRRLGSAHDGRVDGLWKEDEEDGGVVYG